MATVTVKPNADGSVTGTWQIVGGAGSRHASVSHGTSSPDDNQYVRNNMNEGDTNEHMYLGFENMPADFDEITAVTMKIRQKGYNNDDDDVSFQLFQSNGTTALSDKITLAIDGSGVSTSFRTDTISFTRTGSTTKSTWHGVQLKIIHQGPGDGDDPDYSVSEIQLEITYNTASAPEIVMTGLNGENIADGDSSPTTTDGTDFGTITVGDTAVTRVFTVTNSGDADLTLGTPSVPTGFTLTEGLDSSISASASDTFSVRLDNSTAGIKHGDVSIVNNDADENPFNFAISGVLNASPPSITSIIVSGVSQLNTGNALVGVGGARGLGASGTLITEISSKNVLDRTDHEPGTSVTVLDNQYSDRFDDLEYYHGSGTLGGAS